MRVSTLNTASARPDNSYTPVSVTAVSRLESFGKRRVQGDTESRIGRAPEEGFADLGALYWGQTWALSFALEGKVNDYTCGKEDGTCTTRSGILGARRG